MNTTSFRHLMAWMVSLSPIVIAALSMSSCAPDTGFNALEDYNVIVTLYDRQTDFSSYATFAMPDSVVHLKIPGVPVTDQLTTTYNRYILDKVRAEFEQLGYVHVNPPAASPDLYVLVSVTKQDWTEFPYVHHWWANWSWYTHWPGWTQTWGIEYPSRYMDERFTFSMGTVFIDIIDAKNVDAVAKKIPCRWTAVINGVLGYTESNTLERIDSDIKQAFAQSPYL